MGQCHCRFASSAHHEQLLHTATDVAAAVDLVELAVTWDELDYGDEPLIAPHDWHEFWSEHAWPDPDLAFRLFTVALDAARGVRARVDA